MPVLKFPDPSKAGPEGILAIGGDLHPDSLLMAYRQGIFPWPIEGYPLAWFCPPQRGILEFKDLHVGRSLAKVLRAHPFRVSFDQAFVEVIAACSKVPRPGQPGTWITREMISAYVEFHRLGHAHSVEVWDGRELVGGVYGVDVDGVFAGESMFHLKPNTSKIALVALFEKLRAGGAEWMDIQMVTPHMAALGGRNIERDEFLKKLTEGRAKKWKPW